MSNHAAAHWKQAYETLDAINSDAFDELALIVGFKHDKNNRNWDALIDRVKEALNNE